MNLRGHYLIQYKSEEKESKLRAESWGTLTFWRLERNHQQRNEKRERGRRNERGRGKEARQLKCFPEAQGLSHIPTCQEVKCDRCKQVTACVHQRVLITSVGRPAIPVCPCLQGGAAFNVGLSVLRPGQ